MDKNIMTKDRYATFRHIYFEHVHYFLEDFFLEHGITKQSVIEEAGLGGSTLNQLLEGKDIRMNCYLRLLIPMRGYCRDDEDYLLFLMNFLKRCIIEIWIAWGQEPEGWMKETWTEMQKEKKKFNVSN